MKVVGELLVQFWASSTAHHIPQEHFLGNYFPKTVTKKSMLCTEHMWWNLVNRSTPPHDAGFRSSCVLGRASRGLSQQKNKQRGCLHYNMLAVLSCHSNNKLRSMKKDGKHSAALSTTTVGGNKTLRLGSKVMDSPTLKSIWHKQHPQAVYKSLKVCFPIHPPFKISSW